MCCLSQRLLCIWEICWVIFLALGEVFGDVPWSVYFALYASTFDRIPNSVEWQLGTKKLEDLTFEILWDVWLEVEQVEIWLVAYCFANCGWERGEVRCDGSFEMWYWKWITLVI